MSLLKTARRRTDMDVLEAASVLTQHLEEDLRLASTREEHIRITARIVEARELQRALGAW
jgi:hypothetical protein